MTDPINATDVGQADYMKLFMQELTYQDPLKPVDNREFMAQMAQFSALQQATVTSEKLTDLLQATYDNRGISLLGKRVKITGVDDYVTVESIKFKDSKITEIRVKTDKNEAYFIDLNKIIEI